MTIRVLPHARTAKYVVVQCDNVEDLLQLADLVEHGVVPNPRGPPKLSDLDRGALVEISRQPTERSRSPRTTRAPSSSPSAPSRSTSRSSGGPFACDREKCGREFATGQGLAHHKTSAGHWPHQAPPAIPQPDEPKPDGVRHYRCAVCGGFELMTRSEFDSHNAAIHPPDPPRRGGRRYL